MIPQANVSHDPRVPRTKEDAEQRRAFYYYPDPAVECCPKHGPFSIIGADPQDGGPVFGTQSIRYVKTGIWGCCANPDDADAYNAALAAGEPLSKAQAAEMGLPYFWTPLKGKLCGHVGKTRLDGKCYICATKKSPRQEAIEAGETWYQPEPGDLCKNDHSAPRRVYDGACKQCEAERPGKPPKLWESAPDLFISKDLAAANGFKVFRDKGKCRKDHVDPWRYVSNGACLACLGRL